MGDKKAEGAFYTPHSLVKYMVEYIYNNYSPASVLEPSFGDGRFINELSKYAENITGVEKNTVAFKSYKRTNSIDDLNKDDFIHFALNCDKQFDLIIGNPPYIKKSRLPDSARKKSRKLAEKYNLPESVLQNIWVSFILASMSLLSPNGLIFFVLPFEFLQVHYAEKLRTFLEIQFNTIEIITFEKRIFEEVEQDVCLVLLKKSNAVPIITYTTMQDIESQKVISTSEIKRNKPLAKWSNSILNDDEIELLESLALKYQNVNTFGETAPGIVTGANSVFIIPKSKVTATNSEDYVIPVIRKSSYLPPGLFLNQEIIQELSKDEQNIWLLSLSSTNAQEFPKELTSYIKDVEEKKLNTGYKCKNRNRWYDVPIVSKGEVLFFKRFHKLPKLIVNTANVHSTDIAYCTRFHETYDPASYVFCFYNSLTLAMCEFKGRFYGGGVCELVPSEYKSLCIPYSKIDEKHISKLDNMFKKGKTPSEIIAFVDSIVFKEVDSDVLFKLKEIREKFLTRRL